MKYIVLLLCCMTIPASARILDVGPGRTFATLQSAAATALPGDTIRISNGSHAGGQYITGLAGRTDAYITILAETPGQVVFEGGSEAIHFTDPAYVRIIGLAFAGQSGNGVNIDDGGTYDTPAHHIVISNCSWGRMNATGNNDQLKMSGVDYFEIRDCRFSNGSAGGSMVDMVGCHNGIFAGNVFTAGGSNCIQAKGGTSQIRIERNQFLEGGERAINIGGSTGEAFFRPIDAAYEASEIAVMSNWFTGAVAPIAYVGAVRCAVVNNTIIRPRKWVMRILQESTAPRFLPCGENMFVNNIVYIDNAASNPSVNVGPNTAPNTFLFAGNLWYNRDAQSWPGPNLPTAEQGGLLGRDPEIVDINQPGSALRSTSPAIGRGVRSTDPVFDFHGRAFTDPRSIGAVEGAAPNGIGVTDMPVELSLDVYPNPAREAVTLHFGEALHGVLRIRLLDIAGREMAVLHDAELQGSERVLHLALPVNIIGYKATLLEVRHGDRLRLVPLLQH
ncbi:MAG: right-handed parallel beta-helix repeat-containing protein [Ignavibacteriae bacterium]|nr:right-handed parallel beta-helix repeat-containing protein [Ignavibacteriota bacterium]